MTAFRSFVGLFVQSFIVQLTDNIKDKVAYKFGEIAYLKEFYSFSEVQLKAKQLLSQQLKRKTFGENIHKTCFTSMVVSLNNSRAHYGCRQICLRNIFGWHRLA